MAIDRTSWARALAVFLLSALSALPAFPSPAAAQGPAAPPPSPPPTTASSGAATSDKARAVELFRKSEEAYRQGDFAQVIRLLDEAYALDPQPVLVYNRARAAEGLGDLDGAITGYEKFLNDEPNTPDRGAIEQRVATLKRQRDERAALVHDRDTRRNEPPPRPPPPPPAQPPPPGAPEAHRSLLPYVVAGAGGAGLVAGTIFGVMALSKKDDAVAERTQQRSMDLKDSADHLATASTVSFVLGTVLVLAGATWWVVDSGVLSKKNRAGRLALDVSAAGIGGAFP
jgi:tetratricopeptide (TPR) repeat protein